MVLNNMCCGPKWPWDRSINGKCWQDIRPGGDSSGTVPIRFVYIIIHLFIHKGHRIPLPFSYFFIPKTLNVDPGNQGLILNKGICKRALYFWKTVHQFYKKPSGEMNRGWELSTLTVGYALSKGSDCRKDRQVWGITATLDENWMNEETRHVNQGRAT